MRTAAAALALALLAARSSGRSGEPRVVRVVAKRFEFTPSEIRLKIGEPVVLELVSTDRPHGFKLPAFKIREDVLPKVVTRVPLTPDRAGTFTFACDVFCGDGHDDMTGTLAVTE
jgi:cytochrome c oxidase subunit 2